MKIYGAIMAWGLYYLGDLISRPMHWCDLFARAYPLYNWLMLRSADYQDDYDLDGPWERVGEGQYAVEKLVPEDE